MYVFVILYVDRLKVVTIFPHPVFVSCMHVCMYVKQVHSTKDVFRAIGWEMGKALRLKVLRAGGAGGANGGIMDEVVLVTGIK
jgi:hypothetical protein